MRRTCRFLQSRTPGRILFMASREQDCCIPMPVLKLGALDALDTGSGYIGATHTWQGGKGKPTCRGGGVNQTELLVFCGIWHGCYYALRLAHSLLGPCHPHMIMHYTHIWSYDRTLARSLLGPCHPHYTVCLTTLPCMAAYDVLSVR